MKTPVAALLSPIGVEKPIALAEGWLCCILLGVFCLLSCLAQAQAKKEGYNWYFGNKAGITFKYGSPVALSDGQLSTAEGCATISDSAGNLLFYTDGISVWDKTHAKMPHGAGLMGHPSSTQSAVIVPQPGNRALYYVFTVDDIGGPDGFRYSQVDLRLNDGAGDVLAATKNTLLFTPSTEKISAVGHRNGKDYWVLGHKWNSDSFLAYQITSSGLNPVPVATRIGRCYQGKPSKAIGYMKISPDGGKLALCHYEADTVEVFDFDNATGKVSNPVFITRPGDFYRAYGLEFSPDGGKLYFSMIGSSIFQADLSDGTSASINASLCQIDSGSSLYSALQLGPDGKIYVSNYGKDFLSCIANPNRKGSACNFITSALKLDSGTIAILGLPTFIQSFFSTPEIVAFPLCRNAATFFRLSDSSNIDSVFWHVGDAGASVNTFRGFRGSHTYQKTGTYSVRTILCRGGSTDTITSAINIHPYPKPDLGPDRPLCIGSVDTLCAGLAGLAHEWQDGSTDSIFIARTSDTYWVDVTNAGGCAARDTINIITGFPPAPFSLGSDTALCQGISLRLEASSAAPCRWQDGDTNKYYFASEGGLFHVTAENACGSFSDSIFIQRLAVPRVGFGRDTTVCDGKPLRLDASCPHTTCLWLEDGATLPVKTISAPGLYRVRIANRCGIDTAACAVTFRDCKCYIHIPNAFSPNGDGKNDTFRMSACPLEAFQLSIYNRWGERIFESHDMDKGWDGACDGSPSPEGVYLYEIVLRDEEGKEAYRSGMLTLVR